MPNWCENKIYISGTKEAVSKVREIFGGDEPFGKIKPEPNYDEVVVPYFNGVGKEEPEAGRPNAWYDWRILNWGTKWEPMFDLENISTGAEFFREDEGMLLIPMETAWSPPEKICEELVKFDGIEKVFLFAYEQASDFIVAIAYEDGDSYEEVNCTLDHYLECYEAARDSDDPSYEDRFFLHLEELFAIHEINQEWEDE